MHHERLDEPALRAGVERLRRWRLEAGRLRFQQRFGDFSRAFAFMTRVALLAERLGHHPDWSNAYDLVTIELTTHDAGGVTQLDLELADGIEGLLA